MGGGYPLACESYSCEALRSSLLPTLQFRPRVRAQARLGEGERVLRAGVRAGGEISGGVGGAEETAGHVQLVSFAADVRVSGRERPPLSARFNVLPVLLCTPQLVCGFALRKHLCLYGGEERICLGVINKTRNPVSCLSSPQGSADVLRRLLLAYGFQHCGFDPFRFSRQPEMIQHHGGSQDRAKRVRNVLSRNRRCRTVHRLKHRCLSWMDVAARCHSQPTL